MSFTKRTWRKALSLRLWAIFPSCSPKRSPRTMNPMTLPTRARMLSMRTTTTTFSSSKKKLRCRSSLSSASARTQTMAMSKFQNVRASSLTELHAAGRIA
uniref:Putative secreted protein n=1 Tax=Ixodes scapularis TaxID=6945 RepID=A0A4D5RFA5_IXOSC